MMTLKTIVMYCDNCPGEITFEAKDVNIELDLPDNAYVFLADCRGCGKSIIMRKQAFQIEEGE